MMTILKMAYRNIGRNRRRTVLTASTVLAVVMILIITLSYGGGMIGQMFETNARFTTGHLKIYPRGYSDREMLMPLDVGVAASDSVAAAVRELPGVAAVTRRIKFLTMAQIGSRDAFPALMGVEPKTETAFLNLEQHLVKGRYFHARREAILGYGLARKLGVIRGPEDDYRPGSVKVQLLAPRGIPMSFSVVGIYRLGFKLMDDKVMFVAFQDAQYAADMDEDDLATELLILLPDRSRSLAMLGPVQTAAARFTDPREIELLPWQAQGFLYEMMQTAYVALIIIFVILFLIAASTVVNTMLMAVLERTREIGMLMALGIKPIQIQGVILAETLALGIVGGAAGMVLGMVVSLILEQTGIPIGGGAEGLPMPFANIMQVDFVWWYAPASFAAGLVLAAVAALWPAVRASRLSPHQALRTM